MSNNQNKSPEKVVLIINGEPIDVCSKSLAMSLKKAKIVLKTLKKQSRDNAHSLRFFWTDVIMLNIITNQLIQKMDNRDLSRIIKPVNSLQEDSDEYREVRKNKMNRLINTLIMANDDTLPLDYSRELEKYYKTNQVDNSQEIEEKSESLLVEQDNLIKKEDKKEKSTDDTDIIKNNFEKEEKTELKKEENKSNISTTNSSPQSPKNHNSLEESVNSFTQSGELDINSLFDDD